MEPPAVDASDFQSVHLHWSPTLFCPLSDSASRSTPAKSNFHGCCVSITGVRTNDIVIPVKKSDTPLQHDREPSCWPASTSGRSPTSHSSSMHRNAPPVGPVSCLEKTHSAKSSILEGRTTKRPIADSLSLFTSLARAHRFPHTFTGTLSQTRYQGRSNPGSRRLTARFQTRCDASCDLRS